MTDTDISIQEISHRFTLVEAPNPTEQVSSPKEAVARFRALHEARLREQFPASQFPFHNFEDHFDPMATEARDLLTQIQSIIGPEVVTDSDISLVEIEGLAHDDPQDLKSPPRNGDLRNRNRGYNPKTINRPEDQPGIGNEELAADRLIPETRKFIYPDGTPVFPQTASEIRQDIGATCPEPMSNLALRDGTEVFTMIQPHAGTSFRALTLALADLKIYGLPGQDVIRMGCGEFRELFVGMSEDVQAGINNLSPERQKTIQQNIIGWLSTQDLFILGQEVDMQHILENSAAINSLPTDQAAKVRELITARYNAFEENAAKAKQFYEDAKSKDFPSLLSAVGYSVQ